MRPTAKNVIIFFLLILSTSAPFALGQDLFTFVAQDVGPEFPVTVASESASGDMGDMGPEIAVREIRVDLDLLRSAPPILRLPTMAGDGFETFARLHFEDRGDGNVSWSGAPLGVGYESALFTVHADAIVGNFELDGKQYSLGGRGGAGFVAETGEPGGDWCHPLGGGEHWPHPQPLVDPSLGGAEPPGSVVAEQIVPDPQGGYMDPARQVDVVFVVTEIARARMDHSEHGGVGPEATVQALVDYANMVFRNSEIATRVRSVGIEDAPSVSMDWMRHAYYGFGWQGPSLQAIRNAHDADLAHMLMYNVFDAMDWIGRSGVVCGMANLYLRDMTTADMAEVAYGYTNLVCRPDRSPGSESVADLGTWQRVFVHELGHNFGANHNRQIPHAPEEIARAEYGYGVLINPRLDDKPWEAFEKSVWTQSNGSPPLTEPLPDESNTGAYSVMAYPPAAHWVGLPFFSGGGLQEWGVGEYGLKAEDPDTIWVNGHYRKHDNAQLFRSSTRDTASLSEHHLGYPRMPTDFFAELRDLDGGVATVDFYWKDESDDEVRFVVRGVKLNDEGQPDHTNGMSLASASVMADTESAYLRLDGQSGKTWAFWVEAVGPGGRVTPSETMIGTLEPAAPPPPLPPAPTLEHESPDSPVVRALIDGQFFGDGNDKYLVQTITTALQKRQTGETDWGPEEVIVQHPWNYREPLQCGEAGKPDCTHVEIPLEYGTNPRIYDNDYRLTVFVSNGTGDSPKAIIEITGPPLPEPPTPSLFPKFSKGLLLASLDSETFNQPGGGKYRITSFNYRIDRLKNGKWVRVKRETGLTPGANASLDYPPGCLHHGTLHGCTNVAVKMEDSNGDPLSLGPSGEYRLKVTVKNRVGKSTATLTFP